MGYEDADIKTIQTNIQSVIGKFSKCRQMCQTWTNLDNNLTMATQTASGLSTCIDACMGSVFTAYDTFSGAYNGL